MRAFGEAVISTVDILGLRLRPDPRRVVVRPFHLAWQQTETETGRARRLVDRVTSLSDAGVEAELAQVYRDFERRHSEVQKLFERRYDQIVEQFEEAGQGQLFDDFGPKRRQLMGAYMCHEYSYAAAAMMNPSVVIAPDQHATTEGAHRFIMSARTVGEGHISTIAFVEGLVGPGRNVMIEDVPLLATAADLTRRRHPQALTGEEPITIQRHNDCTLGRTVIFPMTETQRNGLEDLRLTPFEHKPGEVEWIGTYTAFSGRAIRSELLRTRDFKRFDLVPMTGTAARNKGMALFPRKIGGRYAMIGRQDGENLFLLYSDTLTHWDDGDLLIAPEYAWEFVQIGNCGAPIELDEGWLLLTHGVGAMRRYSIGAVLLDKDDPSKVLGRTRSPLLEPLDQERDGYVPNVVYTCGAARIDGEIFMPFGIADSSIGFCFVRIAELIADLEPPAG